MGVDRGYFHLFLLLIIFVALSAAFRFLPIFGKNVYHYISAECERPFFKVTPSFRRYVAVSDAKTSKKMPQLKKSVLSFSDIVHRMGGRLPEEEDMLGDDDVILGVKFGLSSDNKIDSATSAFTNPSRRRVPRRNVPRKSVPRSSDVTQKPRSFIPISWRERGVKIYHYANCRMDQEIPKDDYVPINDSSFNITLVTVGSLNRLFVMPIFAGRWNGPVIFTIYLKEEEVERFNSFLLQSNSSSLCHSRIEIFTYVATNGSFFYMNYPINILRNIGIHHVATSHFILVDIDLWFSHSSYEVLLDLPSVIKEDPFAVVVIPAFFHTGWTIANGTLEQQVESVFHRIPYTMKDLQKCARISKCSIFKKHLFTHNYVTLNWVKQQSRLNPPRAYMYNCWKNKYQEPYLLVKRNDSISYFNERFINYGFNKISYVESFRLEGYHFYLAGRMFAFDLPHYPSRYQRWHVNNPAVGNSRTYLYFMERLYKRTRDRQNVLPMCKGKQYLLSIVE